jgi:hypothetical protein
LLAVGTALAGTQTAHPPLVNQTFKDGPEGWVGMGDTAKLSVSHDLGIALPGAGALKFDYTIAKNTFGALSLMTPLDSWTKAKSFKFRVRSDNSTLVAVTLQEQDGGRYSSIIQLPKDTWQTVELSTSDFILGQDANDPKDPDGKLDMDKVTSMSLIDIAEFLVSTDNAALTSLFNIKQGAHTLYFDSFTVGTDPIPADTASSGSTVQLETFAHPQLSWISLGGTKLSHGDGKPLTGIALRADYHQTPGKPALLNHPLPSWTFTGTKMLSFDIASAQAATLIVQLEQVDGGKYNMTIDVPAGSTPQHKKLLLDAFTRGDDSTDKDTKLHLALIKSIAIIDVSGMMTQADKDNTLWLNHLEASASTN